MDVQHRVVPPVVLVEHIFAHEADLIPEADRTVVCDIFREKLKRKIASNETEYVSVVRVFEAVKDQIDEKTTICFLRFLKGAIVAFPAREDELAGRGFDLDKIRALEPLSPEAHAVSPPKIEEAILCCFEAGTH